jgi:hypothetical protein
MTDSVLESQRISAKAQPERDIGSAEAIAALRDVPKGAVALASTTVGLLLVAWLIMYFFVFLPRGTVG